MSPTSVDALKDLADRSGGTKIDENTGPYSGLGIAVLELISDGEPMVKAILKRVTRRVRTLFETAPLPYMSSGEVDMIVRNLRNEHIMLEWGSGGSTLHFPQYVRVYYSIEHDPEWYGRVHHWVQRSHLNNVHLALVPANLPLNGIPNHARSSTERYKQFENYINHIAKLGISRFDRVLIDGRSRPECAVRVLPFLHDDSLVFIHDYYTTVYDREEYYLLIEKHYEVVDSVKAGQSLVVLRRRPMGTHDLPTEQLMQGEALE